MDIPTKCARSCFELDVDDGVRNWGGDLKPASQRIGIAATNRWLQDPIPATISPPTHQDGAAHMGRATVANGTGNSANFNDRMIAFESQLRAMKHDVLAAQNTVLAKKGNGVNSACKVHLLPSSSTCT